MKRTIILLFASLAVVSVGACAGIGKGKGKGKAPPPVSAPLVTKG